MTCLFLCIVASIAFWTLGSSGTGRSLWPKGTAKLRRCCTCAGVLLAVTTGLTCWAQNGLLATVGHLFPAIALAGLLVALTVRWAPRHVPLILTLSLIGALTTA